MITVLVLSLGKGHALDGLYQDQELDPTRQSMMSACMLLDTATVTLLYSMIEWRSPILT